MVADVVYFGCLGVKTTYINAYQQTGLVQQTSLLSIMAFL
jgi:hypothetical protein